MLYYRFFGTLVFDIFSLVKNQNNIGVTNVTVKLIDPKTGQTSALKAAQKKISDLPAGAAGLFDMGSTSAICGVILIGRRNVLE